MRRIRLTNSAHHAVVDSRFYNKVVALGPWSINGDGYARRSWAKRGEVRLLHHVVWGSRIQLDHKNRNSLDCRRRNLRPATHSQNGANRGKPRGSYSSRFKGVCWDSFCGRWKASLTVGTRHTHLGRFDNEVAAARAYNRAAQETWAGFYLPNKI